MGRREAAAQLCGLSDERERLNGLGEDTRKCIHSKNEIVRRFEERICVGAGAKPERSGNWKGTSLTILLGLWNHSLGCCIALAYHS